MTGFCRRSKLVTPASSEKMLEKALTINCDSLVIDLEDAVASTFKHEARQVLRRALARAEPGSRELCVRINGLETPWCLDDLLALEGLPIDTVVVPKVQGPKDLYVYDQLLRQLELREGRRGLTLLALIESAAGVENALSIALASLAICRFSAGMKEASLGRACELSIDQIKFRLPAAFSLIIIGP